MWEFYWKNLSYRLRVSEMLKVGTRGRWISKLLCFEASSLNLDDFRILLKIGNFKNSTTTFLCVFWVDLIGRFRAVVRTIFLKIWCVCTSCRSWYFSIFFSTSLRTMSACSNSLVVHYVADFTRKIFWLEWLLVLYRFLFPKHLQQNKKQSCRG